MPIRRVPRDVSDERRRRVAALRLRGALHHEIVEALHEQGFDNPVTGEKWSESVVAKDLRALKEHWRKQANRSTKEMLGPILAEIRLLRRRAWATNNLSEVRHSLAQEIDLLGLSAPKQLEVNDTSLLALIMNEARNLGPQHEGEFEDADEPKELTAGEEG